MDRRQFLNVTATLALGGTARGGTARRSSQELIPVRLLVLRRAALAPTTACKAPCIRGRLFDVTAVASNQLDETLIPLLSDAQAICDVIERPWANNAANVSSIKRGEYRAAIRDDATKRWMNSENKRWRLELQGTEPRSAIQFHFGQDVTWSAGCFIVGSLRQPLEESGVTSAYCGVDAGEVAIARLRAAVLAPGRDVRNIRIGVADHSALFPDFSPQQPC